MDEYINMSDIEIIYCRKGCAECKNEMCLDEMLRGLPTIDIVHCYECRWLNDKGKANCFIREKTGICRTTFFCAEGERREDD